LQRLLVLIFLAAAANAELKTDTGLVKRSGGKTG